MLNATFARVEEAEVEPLRAWLAGIEARREELRESYRRQGTRHELFFLIRTRGAAILVLISELEDVERGGLSFLRSNLPLDVEFKRLVRGLAPAHADVELLYDSSEYVETTAPRAGA